MKRLILPEKRDVILRFTDIGGTQLKGNMLDKYLFNTNVSYKIPNTIFVLLHSSSRNLFIITCENQHAN